MQADAEAVDEHHDGHGDDRPARGCRGDERGGRTEGRDCHAHGPTDAESSRDRGHDQHGHNKADVAEGERESDRARGRVRLANEVDEQYSHEGAAEEVRRRCRQRDRAQVRVTEEVASALDYLAPEGAEAQPVRPRLGDAGRPADAGDQRSGGEEAESVGNERCGGRRQLDQRAGEARAGDLRARPAQLELAIAVDQQPALDQTRKVRARCLSKKTVNTPVANATA